MTKNLASQKQASNAFQLSSILLIVCLMSIISFSTVFADAHEMEGESTEEMPVEEKPKVTGWFQIDVDSPRHLIFSRCESSAQRRHFI